MERGARTLEWVGGEPTIHLPAILDVMAVCDDLPPVVWKTDLHATPEALTLLEGAVDVYVADFKFGNDDCARRLGGIDNYVATLQRNLSQAARQGDLIVRHLLLPGHFECCFRPIVGWMRTNLPRVKFSIRDGFLPKWQARHYAEISQPLPAAEARAALDVAAAAGLNVIV